MTIRTRIGLVLLATLLAHERPVHASEPLDMFDSEAAAVKHCGRDPVVWLDVPSHAYWVKGQKGYGRSKTGGYTCRKDADHAGNHAKRR
jgi:hypothetical protein